VRRDLDDAAGTIPAHEHVVEQLRRDVARIALVEATGQDLHERAVSRPRSSLRRARNDSSWAATGAGPAPPGVVRRVTATPGSRSFAASAPSDGSAATSETRSSPPSTERRTRPPTTSCASPNL